MVKGGRRKLRKMSLEESSRYAEQVWRSEGFDVHPPRGVKDHGIISRPVRRCAAEMRRYSRLAIKKYNNRLSKPETPRLKFVKVTKAMWQICCVARYFITFEAKEEDSAGGETTKTYQAVVDKPPARKPIKVLSFRECEQEPGSGNIRGKEWLWKGHTL